MALYDEILNELKANSDEKYREFHKKLLNDEKINVLGVRVPVMRELAKKYYPFVEEVLSFPDEYYEITFVKLVCAARLPYERFIEKVDYLVSIINNWACNDSFKAKCIAKHKDEFLVYLQKYINTDKEFYQRYALTTLLDFYVEEKYLGVIYSYCERINPNYYYSHMAAAWLIAEVLIKHYEEGVEFLKLGTLDIKTHNKAIQKARESFRLSDTQKQYLNTLKR